MIIEGSPDQLREMSESLKYLSAFAIGGGAQKITSMISSLENLPVFVKPLEILMLQFSAATTKATMDSMKDLINLVKSDAVQTGISLFATKLGDVVGLFTDFVTIIGALEVVLPSGEKVNLLAKAFESLGKKLDELLRPSSAFIEWLKWLGITLDDTTDKGDELIKTMEGIPAKMQELEDRYG